MKKTTTFSGILILLLTFCSTSAWAYAPPPELRPLPTLTEAFDVVSGPAHTMPVRAMEFATEQALVNPTGLLFEGIIKTTSFIQLYGWAEHLPLALSLEWSELWARGKKRRRKRVRISSQFGPRFHPVLKRWRLHNGVDFAAPTGTPVRSASHGIITYAGRRGASGNLVVVDHLNGYISSYAHLNEIREDLRVGDPVAAGSTLGAVGTTGRSTGPHLHFVIKRHGEPVDPLTVEGFDYVSPIQALEDTLHHKRRVLPMLAVLGVTELAGL